MSVRALVLETGEHVIPPTDELLCRQITRHMIADDGRIGTHAFGPQTSDEGKPSFSRSSVVSAQESRDWHSDHAKSRSQAVRAVPVDAVVKAGTWAIDDSAALLPLGAVRAPGHCYVDYRGLEPREVKAVRASLYMASTEIVTHDNVSGVLFADPTGA